MKILEVKNLEKTYGYKNNLTHVLNGINLSIEKGEFVGIMGSSGSGKSTLLNCISTIDKPTKGEIFINEKNIINMKDKEIENFRNNNLSFIFQDFNLLDTLTCEENIALALAIQKTKYTKINEYIMAAAEKLKINHILNKYPYEISGGQKQRVAAARAIVTNPDIILADEPTGALDSKSATTLLEYLKKLNTELNSTILMVTHDSFAASYTDKIFFIKDGKILKEIVKGNKSRRDFFNEIMKITTVLEEI